MLIVNRKICATALGLVIMLAAVVPVNAQSFGGSMSNKKKVAIIAGGAAAGAVIGGLLGGKKGAIIGGVAGGGAGTGYVYYKGKQEEDRYGYYGYGDDYYYDRYEQRRDARRYARRSFRNRR